MEGVKGILYKARMRGIKSGGVLKSVLSNRELCKCEKMSIKRVNCCMEKRHGVCEVLSEG